MGPYEAAAPPREAGPPRTFRFVARGSSMRPFIHDGDTLVVEEVMTGGLRRGDVVFCRETGGRLVAHRVIGRRAGGGESLLMLRGDAVRAGREYAPESAVVGRVTAAGTEDQMRRLDRPIDRWSGLVWSGLWGLLWRSRRNPRRTAAAVITALLASLATGVPWSRRRV